MMINALLFTYSKPRAYIMRDYLEGKTSTGTFILNFYNYNSRALPSTLFNDNEPFDVNSAAITNFIGSNDYQNLKEHLYNVSDFRDTKKLISECLIDYQNFIGNVPNYDYRKSRLDFIT